MDTATLSLGLTFIIAFVAGMVAMHMCKWTKCHRAIAACAEYTVELKTLLNDYEEKTNKKWARGKAIIDDTLDKHNIAVKEAYRRAIEDMTKVDRNNYELEMAAILDDTAQESRLRDLLLEKEKVSKENDLD